jgi:hypothetical protein
VQVAPVREPFASDDFDLSSGNLSRRSIGSQCRKSVILSFLAIRGPAGYHDETTTTGKRFPGDALKDLTSKPGWLSG